MTTDNRTLADVQPGGRVRLGDQAERARFEAWNRENWPNLDLSRGPLGDYMQARVRSDWQLWQAAQPSPGGQDALAALQQDYDKLLDSFDRQVEVAEKIAGRVLQQDDRIEELEEALAARPPVGQIDEAAVLRRAADVLYMWEDDPNLTGHMGDFKDACDILEVLAQNAAQPAQAVDLKGARDSIQALLNWIDDWAETPEESGLDPIADRALEVVAQIDAQVYAHEPNTNPAQAVDLAPDHRGMRVSCSGLLSQVRGGLKSNPELAEMVRQLHGHLNELGKRWYAGDRKVVDEFLQLYVIEDGARRALTDSQAVGK